MNFTLSNDSACDELIESRLNIIVSDVLEVIKPRSIILYGSLGRGEGTVKNTPEGIKILSDFEIGIVSNNAFVLRHMRDLRNKINIESRCDVTLSFFLPRRFTHIINSNWSFFQSRWMTLEQYDLLEGMKVLYGIDPRAKRVNLAVSNIMHWDALRLIFNRSAELLIPFVNSMEFRPDLDKPLNKLLIACGDAVLILSGDYHCSYTRRKELIEANRKSESKRWPSNVNWDLVISGYNWKLNASSPNFASGKYEEILNNVYIPILKYCTEQIFGWTFHNIEEFGNRYLAEKHLKDCSRLYPGFPLLQDCMFVIRGALHHKLALQLFTSKQAHGVFVEIVNRTERLFNQMHRQSPETYSTDDMQKIISKWEIVSSVL